MNFKMNLVAALVLEVTIVVSLPLVFKPPEEWAASMKLLLKGEFGETTAKKKVNTLPELGHKDKRGRWKQVEARSSPKKKITVVDRVRLKEFLKYMKNSPQVYKIWNGSVRALKKWKMYNLNFESTDGRLCNMRLTIFHTVAHEHHECFVPIPPKARDTMFPEASEHRPGRKKQGPYPSPTPKTKPSDEPPPPEGFWRVKAKEKKPLLRKLKNPLRKRARWTPRRQVSSIGSADSPKYLSSQAQIRQRSKSE